MKKKYIIYKQDDKIKKAVLDENMLKVYRNKKDINSIQEFDTEILMPDLIIRASSTLKKKGVKYIS